MNETKIAAARLLMQAVFRGRGHGRWRIHLSVVTENRKQRPTVPYQWQRASMFGVSFNRRDAKQAEAWILEAIRAGYRPFYHFRRTGAGYCPNEVDQLLKTTP